MKSSEEIKKMMVDVQINTSYEKDKQVLDDVITAMEQSKTQSVIKPSTWRIIMKNRMTKFGPAAAVLLVALYMLIGNQGRTAWAFEQSIDAIKNYNSVYMEGTLPDGYFELWGRSDENGGQSEDFVVRTSNGIVSWVKDGSTYIYIPTENKVYFENAITNGFSQWLGSELLELLASMKSTKVMYGKDPDTGRELVTVMSSILDVKGPQSFIINFDAETKLAVSMKQWDNMDMSGVPGFVANKIIFYKDVDDSLFEVTLPENPSYVEKPLTIPDENISLLSNPDYGISTEGMSEQDACDKIITEMYEAIIAGDIEQIKQLCPVSANLDDKFITNFIIREGKDNQVVELLEIGKISRTGQTKLGTIAAVPVICKCKDGTKMKDKMIVQFRNLAGEPSCVVYGPYGISQTVK